MPIGYVDRISCLNFSLIITRAVDLGMKSVSLV